MCRKRIARLKQILGHGRTHVAKTYKCDMRHVVLSVLLAAHYCARVGIGLILPWKFARSSPSILSPLHPEEANLAFAQMGFMYSVFERNRCDHRSEEHTSELKSLMRISYA